MPASSAEVTRSTLSPLSSSLPRGEPVPGLGSDQERRTADIGTSMAPSSAGSDASFGGAASIGAETERWNDTLDRRCESSSDAVYPFPAYPLPSLEP